MKNKIILIVVIVTTFACTKKATIKLPKAETKLVVTCFISPEDSLISAVVKKSTSKFNSGNSQPTAVSEDDLQNATVIISNSSNGIVLEYNPNLRFYVAKASQFPIVSGQTYSLSVQTPEGLKANSSTTVPEGKLTAGNFDINYKKNEASALDFSYNLEVNDLPNQINYVGIFDQSKFVIKHSNYNGPLDTVETGSGSGFFETDEKISKSKYYFTSEFNMTVQSGDSISFFDVSISVLNSSKEFHLYNQSAQKSNSSSRNPFSDPVLIYTNITNGFGCFGSYVHSYVNKRIRN